MLLIDLLGPGIFCGTLYDMVFISYRCAEQLQWAARIIFLFSFCFGGVSPLFCASQSIYLFPAAEKNNQTVHDLVPEPFLLELVSYESDVRLESEEFFYLTDLQNGITVCADQLLRAAEYLFKKRKFSRIQIIISDGVEGKQLHFSLVGFTTFAKLKFRGLLIGKDRYRQYYLMDPGDPFDQEKHSCSLKKIRQAFRQEGFFAGTVTDQINEDRETKTISVSVALSRGSRFFIDSIFVEQKQNNQDLEQKGLIEKVADRLKKRLEKKGYDRQLINQETKYAKQMLARSGFSQIEVELEEKINYAKKTVSLQFSIDFLQKRQFVFFGNSFFSDAQLLETVFLFGKSARLIPVSVLGQEIAEQYKQNGFWSVSVETKEEEGRDFFIIKEGNRAVIKSIFIKGAQRFTQKSLLKKCFGSVLRARHIDEEKIKKAQEKLLSFYRQQGFAHVAILDVQSVCLDKKKQWYSFQLVLEEGPQMFFQTAYIPGFEKLLLNWPFKKCNKTKNKIPLSPKLVQEQKKWLQKYFAQKGNPEAIIEYEQISGDSGVVLQWNIDLKNKKKFGKTIVCDCGRLPFSVVKRQLCYKKGDFFDVQKLRQSRNRLRRLDIFDQVHLYPDLRDKKDGNQDLLLKLRLDDPFECRVRAGFGLQQVGRHFPLGRGVTYKVGGTFLMKNPTNAGDYLAFDADVARGFRNVSLDYHRPQFFSFPVLSQSKVYANRYEQPGFIGCKKNLYEIFQNGFLVGLRDKYRYFDTGCNVGFEWMQTNIKDGMQSFADAVARAIQFQSVLLGKNIPYFFIEPILIVDRLDDKLQPRSGFFTLLTCKGMFPLSDKYADMFFVKLLAEQSFFTSFAQKIVLALHLRFGHIFHQTFETIMPFERFYLGGAHSIRSYETDMCPPLGCFIDSCGDTYLVPRGGKTSVQTNFEARFSLVGSVGAVLFQDFGTLIGQTTKGFDLSDLLAATGFGLRYDTPFGPLRFDVGFKWKVHDPTCHSYAWFLTLGHAF